MPLVTVGDLDRIFKAYDVRGVVPDDLDEDIARRIGAAFAEWSGAPRRGDRPGLPTLVARARQPRSRRASRRGASASSTSGSRRPTCSTSRRGSLDLPGDHAHREPQPEAVQRAEVLPRGARSPSGRTAGSSRSGRSTEQDLPPTGERGTVEHGTCSRPTSNTCSRSWTPRACGR